MNAEWMTVQEAAVFLGISATSIKRLCDANQIESARTHGGHRRIHRQHVEAFQLRLNPQTRGDRNKPNLKSDSDLVEAFETEMLRGDALACWSRLTDLISRRCSLTEALEHFLVPAIWRVGDRWQRKEISIYQEHLATHVCEKTLDRILFQLGQGGASCDASSSRGIAIGGALEKSRDTIASKLVEILFSQHGFQALNLGAFLPIDSLVQASLDLGATWVWCCYTHLEDPRDFIEQQSRLAAMLPPHVQIVVGGGAVSPALRRSLQRAVCLESLAELERKLRCPERKPIPAPHFL